MSGESGTDAGKALKPPAKAIPLPTQLSAPVSSPAKLGQPGGNGLAARALADAKAPSRDDREPSAQQEASREQEIRRTQESSDRGANTVDVGGAFHAGNRGKFDDPVDARNSGGSKATRVVEHASVATWSGGAPAGPAKVSPRGGTSASRDKDGASMKSQAAPGGGTANLDDALAVLRGVRPDKLGPLFGQAYGAMRSEITQGRAALKANPPRAMTSGGAAGKLPVARTGAHSAPASKAPNQAPERSVNAEVPGGGAAKQAQQSQAAAQQEAAAQATTKVAQEISSWFASWFGGIAASGDDPNAPRMSDAEARQMSDSIDRVPTAVSDISTDAGPAPELAMNGEAKGSADQDHARFEAATTSAEAEGRADSRVPMGEDHIDTTLPAAELTAAPSSAGAPPSFALPTVAGAATSEEVGIVAQEQAGAEIDAALAKAGTAVTAERDKHAAEEAKAHSDADTQIRDLKAKADADQTAARSAAQAEVSEARGQWRAEIDNKGAAARKKADAKVAEGAAHIQETETNANAEAKQHIEKGKRDAEAEKQNGEKDAAEAKEKAKNKSSGVWGWVKSKAAAVFDAIKKAVSAVIDACRDAIKAVINGAKKLAMAAIELARKTIVAAIKAVGEALIEISDVLLAAFPEIKEKFQNAVRKTVDKAVDTVNKFADRLKGAVQKALDALGTALDKALALLEKGIDFILDAANAVVQRAISAAQAVVEVLAIWAKLIKDIATGPGAWIGALGAAVVDGIKNHLWSAFKVSVVEWFKGKVMDLLGIGGIILELLLEDGLTTDDIVQMAFDAVVVAIPAILVEVLIKQLVSILVPGIGALVAIIDTMRAAWGVISRIIAVFTAFMNFLLAVHGGTAGPLFATLLAAAAIVLLDFVATWLLERLARAANKVAVALKGRAEKFRAKRQAKKDAKSHKHDDDHHGPDATPTKHHDNYDGRDGRPPEHELKHDKAKPEEASQKGEIQRRVDKAQRELPAKIWTLLSRRRSKLALRGQFALWKLRFHLSRLELEEGAGAQATIVAQVNPLVDLGPAGRIWKVELWQVLKIFDDVAGQYVGRAANGDEPDLRTRAEGEEAHLEREGLYILGYDSVGREARFEVRRVHRGRPWTRDKDNEVRRPGAAKGDRYWKMFEDLKASGVDPKLLGAYLRAGFNKQPLPPLPAAAAAPADALLGVWQFEAGHPRSRIYDESEKSVERVVPSFGHRRDYIYAMMTVELLEKGDIDLKTAIMAHPAQGHKAQEATRRVTGVHLYGTQRQPGEDTKEYPAYMRRETREVELIRTWLHAKAAGPEAPIWREQPSSEVLKTFVIEEIRKFRR